MPFQDSISEEDIDETVVIARPTGWVRHNHCGHRFFFIRSVDVADIVCYCPNCKKQVRLILGVDIETEIART